METQDRLFVALDVNHLVGVQPLLNDFAPDRPGAKVGLELLHAAGTPNVVRAIQELGNTLLADAKLHDIPTTVMKAAAELTAHGVDFFNVMALGGRDMMESAKLGAWRVADQAGKRRPKILAVTILTSHSYQDLVELHLVSHVSVEDPDKRVELEQARIAQLVGDLAAMARDCGLDGVIASPREVREVRRRCGPDFLIATPGIRPDWAAAQDQKRVMTPAEAIRAGSDILIIGRPLTNPPAEIGTPRNAYRRIKEEIEGALQAI